MLICSSASIYLQTRGQATMSTFKPKFWKPGTEFVGWKEERGNSESSQPVICNENASLSIENQRQRLPIFKHRNHILYLLEKYQTVVIVGETGCGKSTQIPQYLLEAGWASGNLIIGITEPRRVAAITLASRVAEEKGTLVGQLVGYSIRFDDYFDAHTTKIKFMTEGILIREMMGDPLLTPYSVLILDEAHERSLDMDILMGLMKKILKKRKDLRLIVSSATLEAEQLRNFFNNNESDDRSKDTAAILSVEGRRFPVDVFYVNDPVPDYVKASVETVIKIHETETIAGHILVFLTGQEEVMMAVSLLKDYAREKKNKEYKVRILPLYRALPHEDQLKVFQPCGKGVRKVVVATNIAEASVTIDGITHVVDCGFAKLRYFDSTGGTDRLAVVPISQASAEQRAGRAGRVRPGKAYRLYKEDDYSTLQHNTPPEIQRSNLCRTILQLKALGISNILRFNFPAAPPAKNVIVSLEILYALGALDDDGELTEPLGKMMAEFPLDPMFSKCLLISGEFGCSEEILSIAAMLQVENIFLSPSGQNAALARKAKYLFSVEEGDHITLLNVYNAFVKQGRSRKWCEKYFLNYKGLQRAHEIRQTLANLLTKFKVPFVSSDDVDCICRCIVAGFFANASFLHPLGDYHTVRGDRSLHIHPSSVLYTQKQPSWVIFNEVLHTSKEFMRDVLSIPCSWLHELAPHYYRYGTEREVAAQEDK